MRIPIVVLLMFLGGMAFANALTNGGWHMVSPLKDGSVPRGYPFDSGNGSVEGMTGGAAVYFRAYGGNNFYGRNGAILRREISPEVWLGKRARLTLRLRKEGRGEADLRVHIEKRNGVSIAATPQNIDDGDWKIRQVVLDVPEDAIDFVIDLHLSGKGGIWIDRIALETVGEDVALTGSRRDDTNKFPTVPGPIVAPWNQNVPNAEY
jgi:hypothetical protein